MSFIYYLCSMDVNTLERGEPYYLIRQESNKMTEEYTLGVYQGPLWRSESAADRPGYIFSIYDDRAVIIVWEFEVVNTVYGTEMEARAHVCRQLRDKLNSMETTLTKLNQLAESI